MKLNIKNIKYMRNWNKEKSLRWRIIERKKKETMKIKLNFCSIIDEKKH